MARSHWWGWCLRFALLAGLGAAVALGHSSPALAARPNFVVIQTDDQSAATVRAMMRGRNGVARAVMPQTLSQVVNQGTEFTNYYATSPLCSPSRASLLSGQYSWNSGVVDNEGADGGWPGWQNSDILDHNLPVTLSADGYRTAHFGKFTNSYFDEASNRPDLTVPPGWKRWFTTAYLPGTRFYGYQLNVDGRAVGPIGDPNYRSEGPGIDPASCDPAKPEMIWPRGKCRYLTDVVSAAAVKEILRDGKRPFYIQIDYQAPHGDVAAPTGPQPATRDLGSASNTPLPRPGSFNEADFSDKPALVRQAAPFPMTNDEISSLANSYRTYLESLKSVDDGVGAVLAALRQVRKLSNTYVVVTSDHGIFMGEHRFDWGKFLAYEDSSSVLTAVRGPGVTAGARSAELVGNIDLPATIMDLAGTDPDYPVDGRSLVPFWTNPGKVTNRPIAISLNSNESGDDERKRARVSARAPALRYRGFRVGPYKYIRYDEGGEELYDLSKDPDELRNRATSPAYANVLTYMRGNLDKVTNCQAETCRTALPPRPSPG